ncbi:MAG: hypothetical protein KatS3mg076_2855 [Candidatus Binatia bacterium]|nr:MAG: hypothetical protein KatS3mg076_2855 [Candidatus Binatia bacterium]
MKDHSVGEAYPQLFQPDTILPSQFFAALGRRGRHEPELRLVIAILQDAIECYQKHLFARDQKSRQLFRDAEEWIFSGDKEYFFSFENVCMLLNIDPDWLRQGLLRWRARQEALRAGQRPKDAEKEVGAEADENLAAAG